MIIAPRITVDLYRFTGLRETRQRGYYSQSLNQPISSARFGPSQLEVSILLSTPRVAIARWD